MVFASCGPARAPERCRSLISAQGWLLPPFARLEQASGVASFVVETGPASGAIAQQIPRPKDLSGLDVIAVGYAKVESAEALDATDDDVTGRLWDGTVNLVNAWSKNGRDFPGPYARLRFTGREVASGAWKRLVTEAIPAGGARWLYPHFAFWGARLAPGVKLHLAGLSLVEAPAEAPVDPSAEPEPWVECPSLPAPTPVLESPTRRQFKAALPPDGSFDDSFALQLENAETGWRLLRLTARYRQGSLPADRFLISITEDGTDPRLSPTSRVSVILARRGDGQIETAVRARADAKPLAIAIAAAAATRDGLRPQAPVLPTAWQRPHL